MTATRFFIVAAITIISHVSIADAQVASNPPYTLEQAVISSGGTVSSGSIFTIEGTMGQPIAGHSSSNSPYNVRSGFRTAVLSPTAANAAISGRVIREDGRGLKDVRIILSGGTLTARRVALTNPFGYFYFVDVEVGETYIVSVSHKRYGFNQSSQTFTLLDNLTGLNFQTSWTN